MDLWPEQGVACTLQNASNYSEIRDAPSAGTEILNQLAADNFTNRRVHLGDVKGKRNFAALFLLIIPTMTVFGNLLVVISVYRERTLRTATNYLIISLAVADMLVALCVMPFAVYVEVENGVWKLPKGLCTCYIAIDVCASTASILNLVAISWDRYMAVSHPIEYSQSRRRKNRVVLTMILTVWSISIVIASPMAAGLNRLDDTPYCEFTNAVYTISSSFASFYLPCLIMVALYSVVLKKLSQRRGQRTRSHGPSPYCSRNKGSKRSAPSFFRSSVHTNNDTTTNNEISVATRVFQAGHEENERVAGFDHHNHNYHNLEQVMVSGSAWATGQSGGLAVSASMEETCPRQYVQQCDYKTDKRDSALLLNDWSKSIINNNTITTGSVLIDGGDSNRCDFRRDNSEIGFAFQVEIDNESVPFIDASSAQGTPARRKKHSSPVGPTCNGAMKRAGNSIGRICSVAPLRQNSSSCLDQTQVTTITANLDSRTALCVPNKTCDLRSSVMPLESRRHSVASFMNKPTWAKRKRPADRGYSTETRDANKRNTTNISAVSALAAKYSRQSRKERRATHTLAIVLVVFLCCWLPFFTCHITISVCRVRSGDTCINIVAFFFTTWLGYTNSFMNPIIYTIFNPEYRRAFKNALCCRAIGRYR